MFKSSNYGDRNHDQGPLSTLNGRYYSDRRTTLDRLDREFSRGIAIGNEGENEMRESQEDGLGGVSLN